MVEEKQKDKKYMKKVINLAQKGEGCTSPNPMVGAIVVKNDEIVGQGYHHFFGDVHAEVNALEEAGDRARNAVLYVNLEPCCHYGKTPPCYHKIIEAGVKKVVIGMEDPNPKVSGKGIMYLKKTGIEVKTGVLEKEVKKLNEFFIKYITEDIPFVIVKSAQTLDGYLATHNGDSRWITNKKARNFGHHLRHKVDSILVGKRTVLNDNPRLTTRLPEKEGKDSLRIILDEKLEISENAKLINHNSPAETLIVTGNNISEEKKTKIQDKRKIKIMSLPLDENNQIPLQKLFKILHDEENITSVLVEGGGTVNHSLLTKGLIDKLYMFISAKILGGNDGISVFNGKGPSQINKTKQLHDIEIEKLDNNFLVKGYLN